MNENQIVDSSFTTTRHTYDKEISDNAAELATYIVEKGKPLVTLVK